MEFDEQQLVGTAGVLLVRRARLQGPSQAEVLVVHGLGEHAGRYGHVAEALSIHGLRFWGYDLQGHGRSDGMRGDAATYEALLADLDRVCGVVAKEDRPLFLLGHSMGGQLVLNYLLHRRVRCQGAVVSSPWLRLSFDPPLWRRLLALAAARLWPRWAQGTSSISDRLSRDLAHVAGLPEPELTHQQISARLFLAVQRAGREALARAGAFTIPVLLLHGETDAVTSPAATAEFFARAAAVDKKLVLFPGAMHELHNDLDREQVLHEMAVWMLSRVSRRLGGEGE